MEAFCGSWKLVASENLGEYLKALGLEHEPANVGNVLKPVLTISKEGGNVVVRTVTSISSREVSFKLDEEFDEKTSDGRNTKSVVYLEGDKFVHVQKWDDKQSTVTREIKDSQMITTLAVKGTVAVCTYERV